MHGVVLFSVQFHCHCLMRNRLARNLVHSPDHAHVIPDERLDPDLVPGQDHVQRQQVATKSRDENVIVVAEIVNVKEIAKGKENVHLNHLKTRKSPGTIQDRPQVHHIPNTVKGR